MALDYSFYLRPLCNIYLLIFVIYFSRRQRKLMFVFVFVRAHMAYAEILLLQ